MGITFEDRNQREGTIEGFEHRSRWGGASVGWVYRIAAIQDGEKRPTSQERYQDNAQCQMQANYVQVADCEYHGTFMEGVNINQKQQQTYQLCISSKGYCAVMVQ